MVLDTFLVKFITEQTGGERNQWHSVVLVSLMLRSHTHMPTSGLFIIRHTNRSYASSILEMLWLCSDHTPAKHLTIKAFLLQGHINSCLYRATQFDLTQYYISIQNYNVLVQIRLTSKTKRVSSISNLVYELPH